MWGRLRQWEWTTVMADLPGDRDEGGSGGRRSPGFQALTIQSFNCPAMTVSYGQGRAHLTP